MVSQKIGDCAQASLNRGYSHFGLKNDGECWSGPDAQNTYSEGGSSTGCQNGIGASNAYTVYKFI